MPTAMDGGRRPNLSCVTVGRGDLPRVAELLHVVYGGNKHNRQVSMVTAFSHFEEAYEPIQCHLGVLLLSSKSPTPTPRSPVLQGSVVVIGNTQVSHLCVHVVTITLPDLDTPPTHLPG